jgi:flagellar basal body-associated protein FliL
MKFFPLIFILFISTFTSAFASAGGGGTSPFIPMNPPIVVNIMDGQRIRHMQVMVELKVPDPDNAKKVEFHKGAIRNELILLLSSQEMSTISSATGKEELRKEALAAVQKVINKLENVQTPEEGAAQGNEAEGNNATKTNQIIEGLYFTNFIIQ